MVGGMGRTALYLKVSPAGLACGPITSGGRIYTLTRHSRPPGTPRSFISFPSKFPGMSLHFLPLHCRFSSLHFLEGSFIRIPFFGFSPAPSSFSCNSFDFHFVHFPVTAPCFASPACIASSASSEMMLAMLGVLSSIRHPPKILVFGLVFGCCGEMLQKRLNQSANPSPLIREGPA